MMNVQILTGTSGVARYVVKYICKVSDPPFKLMQCFIIYLSMVLNTFHQLDEGNRVIMWADGHSGKFQLFHCLYKGGALLI